MTKEQRTQRDSLRASIQTVREDYYACRIDFDTFAERYQTLRARLKEFVTPASQPDRAASHAARRADALGVGQ